jgi:hypothetical protein
MWARLCTLDSSPSKGNSDPQTSFPTDFEGKSYLRLKSFDGKTVMGSHDEMMSSMEN